jgi:hypothetical protein
MSAIVHQDLIDASELDSLLQRLTTAQNDKERLRHLKTAARNYTFDGGQIARLLAPMAASPAAAVEAAVMLLRRAVPRAADPAAVETAVAALVYDEQRADVKARLGLGPGNITDAAEPLAVSSTAADEALRGFADRSGAIALNCPAVPTADGRGVTMSVPVKVQLFDPSRDGQPEKIFQFAAMDDATFRDTFGMDRAAFEALPQWRQIALKKEKGLF